MEFHLLSLFEGVNTLVDSFAKEPAIGFARVGLILLGALLMYLGKKGVLEALIMVPMGLGMISVNCGVMFLPKAMRIAEGGDKGTLHVNSLATTTDEVVTLLQIDWLQPIYTLTFSNGLIAVLVFMGIGSLLDVGFLMARPFQSMLVAVCGELGTLVVFPLGVAMGLTPAQAAATATIGGADGPMVLFATLMLAKELFVPITIVAYLYLGLTYGGYPYLIRLMIPERLRKVPMEPLNIGHITAGEKIVFAVVACALLSLLFPVAAPLFLALFMGVVVRESGLKHFHELFSNQVLYGATFFLGLTLGLLCEGAVILDPRVLKLLVLGILAIAVSGVGGILGGYLMYFLTKGKFNPVVGIAAVSCVPTTAKVAQYQVSAVAPDVIVLPHALGANVSGVITSAIFAATLVAMVGGH